MEDIKWIQANAFNKVFYYIYNFKSVLYNGSYYPEAIVAPDWTCNTEHIAAKWKDLDNYPHEKQFLRFYAELDNENRRIMLDWIQDNYQLNSQI